MVCIYTLRLEYNKYYIGKTNNPKYRLEDHFVLGGSAWTKKYQPVEIIEIIDNCDDFDEDKYTKKYMKNYGIENVRGGSYVQIELSSEVKKFLEKELLMSSDKCFKCGQKGHFAKDCFRLRDNGLEDQLKYKEEIIWCCNVCNKEFLEEIECQKHINRYHKPKFNNNKVYGTCFRCGRTSHYANECYAKTHVGGYYI